MPVQKMTLDERTTRKHLICKILQKQFLEQPAEMEPVTSDLFIFEVPANGQLPPLKQLTASKFKLGMVVIWDPNPGSVFQLLSAYKIFFNSKLVFIFSGAGFFNFY